MYLHANAKLGLAGRVALVRAIEAGLSLKAAGHVIRARLPPTRCMRRSCASSALLRNSRIPNVGRPRASGAFPTYRATSPFLFEVGPARPFRAETADRAE